MDDQAGKDTTAEAVAVAFGMRDAEDGDGEGRQPVAEGNRQDAGDRQDQRKDAEEAFADSARQAASCVAGPSFRRCEARAKPVSPYAGRWRGRWRNRRVRGAARPSGSRSPSARRRNIIGSPSTMVAPGGSGIRLGRAKTSRKAPKERSSSAVAISRMLIRSPASRASRSSSSESFSGCLCELAAMPGTVAAADW
jgi:hypothetical protein